MLNNNYCVTIWSHIKDKIEKNKCLYKNCYNQKSLKQKVARTS